MNWKTLKAHFNVEAVLAGSGKLQGLRASSHRLIGPCPIHGGDNPTAFSVDRTRDLWYCFTRCATGGDSLALAWRLCGRSWPATAQWLESLLPSTLTLQTTNLAMPAKAPSLQVSPSAAKRRPRAFAAFTTALRLDEVHSFFRERRLTPAILGRFEAGVWHGRGFLEGMAAVRLHDLAGRPLGYAGRRLAPDEIRRYGKWKWPPGYPKSSLLYNWHRARRHLPGGLVVVESPWSVMRLAQEGLHNTVALGGLTVSPTQASLLAAADYLVLMLDADPAGEQATRRLLAARIHPRLRVLRPPTGTDPADLDRESLHVLLAALSHIAPSVALVDTTAPTSNTIADGTLGNRNQHCGVNSPPNPNLTPHSLHRTPPRIQPVAEDDPQSPLTSPSVATSRQP